MQEFTIIEKSEDGAVIEERKQYTLTPDEARMQLSNLTYQKESLVRESKRIANEYRALEAREKQLKELIDSFEAMELEIIE